MPLIKKQFIIHVDVKVKDQEPLIRFSISNMFDKVKVKKYNKFLSYFYIKSNHLNTLQLPYSKENPIKWTILTLDLEFLLDSSAFFSPLHIKSFRNIHSIKSIQICSNLLIRGVYTSDNLYNLEVKF